MRPVLCLKPHLEPLSTAEAYANLPPEDQQTVEALARSGDWIGKYAADGFSPEHRIWTAIERAFERWCLSRHNAVPFQAQEIFARMAKLVKPARPASYEDRRHKNQARILQSSGTR